MAAVAAAKYIKSEFEFPMLIEHGGQVLSPVLLVMALTLGARHRVTVNTAIIAVVMTFAGHGLYAAGVWPTPSTFIGMTRSIFGWDYTTTKVFLRVAGFLDANLDKAVWFQRLVGVLKIIGMVGLLQINFRRPMIRPKDLYWRRTKA